MFSMNTDDAQLSYIARAILLVVIGALILISAGIF